MRTDHYGYFAGFALAATSITAGVLFGGGTGATMAAFASSSAAVALTMAARAFVGQPLLRGDFAFGFLRFNEIFAVICGALLLHDWIQGGFTLGAARLEQ